VVMKLVQNQTGEHYRMEAGRKCVLAIVAGSGWRAYKVTGGSGWQPSESAHGVPDVIRRTVGRSNHEKG